jgi:hypothetical protein
MWRALLARAAVFHATRTRLSPLSDMARQGGVVELVLRKLEIQAREWSIQDIDDETTVTRVVEAWIEAIAELLALRSLEIDVRALLTDLQTLVRCARWEDPFRQIFASISCLAESLYGAAWRRATLRVAHVRSHPRGARCQDDPYPVTAVTPWPPDEIEAKVELQIFCDAFGPAAYAALPMVLTHECVCHVPARQDKAKNDSPFAEGFLDWAAYYFFGRWATKLDSGLAPAARRHARELRVLLTHRTDTSAGRARRVGHDAAETLHAWFENACGLTPDESEAQVAKLAVRLNLVDRPIREKDLFVSRLGDPLPPDVEAVLREWIEDGAAAELLLGEPSLAGAA